LAYGAFAAVLLAGCATNGREDTRYLGAEVRSKPNPYHDSASWDTVSYWDGDGLHGPAHVEIDLKAQRAYFYKGRHLAGVSLVSTGREGFNTPPGTFRITQKSPNHRSNLYGDFVDANGNTVKQDVDATRDSAPTGTRFLGASMPNFLRFNGGVGMHAGYLPGYPASHGCVRLPPKMAQYFYENVSIGTPVTVVN